MCRLAGVIAEEVTEFGLVLKEAPRSLARLSSEHPDGWGIAAHGSIDSMPPSRSEGTRYEGGWRIQKGTERAADCHRFQSIASQSTGTILIAHVRQKTVGPTSIANTHPFMQSGWVFAHNGTIQDQAFVRESTSEARLAEVRGETDSEMLFAYFLTRLDEIGLSSISGLYGEAARVARDKATRTLADATEELRNRKVGAFNFLMSDGESCFIHRFGRSLFLLDRTPRKSRVPRSDELPTSARQVTWVERRRAVLVASEQLTDEPWVELPEGTFLRVDRDPTPTIAWPEAFARLSSIERIADVNASAR
jgi:predicted glutamine amidotransferase